MRRPCCPHRDIDVVAKERAQRHVPTFPELGGSFGDIRIIEVPRIVEPHHLSQAGGHIGISGEVEMDLERVGKDSERHPMQPIPASSCGSRESASTAIVLAKRAFFPNPIANNRKPWEKTSRGAAALIDLFLDLRVPDDRPGNELGEHGDVHSEVHDISLRTGPTPIHVRYVGNCLQREKRDTYGEVELQA